MTKEEIVQSLRACGEMDCSPCKYRRSKEPFCVDALIRDATNLIEAQAAEIEKLKSQVPRWIPVTERLPEQDYQQDRLDRALKDVFGGDLQPFAVRYPFIKDQKIRR
mgnify:CR=1 FL=1